MMKLNSVLAAAALASCAITAWAGNSNTGALQIAPSFFSNVPGVAPGAANDLPSFLFPAGAGAASGTAMTIDVTARLSISNIQISVLDVNPGALVVGAPAKPSILFDQALTAGNSYLFQVTGSVAGLAGANDVLLPTISPVPEPGTWALMLSGMAVVGVLVRRRRLGHAPER
jgi:hypothetical protein